jgi:hypothetical protein
MEFEEVSADEIIWMIHEALREEFGNFTSYTIAVLPDSRLGWVVALSRRKADQAKAGAAARIAARLRVKYRLRR